MTFLNLHLTFWLPSATNRAFVIALVDSERFGIEEANHIMLVELIEQIPLHGDYRTSTPKLRKQERGNRPMPTSLQQGERHFKIATYYHS
jgi:hypothetical protein